jgi:DNA repair photolyase
LGDKALAQRWGSLIRVKENVAEKLQEDLRKKRRGQVGVGTVTDPYQPLEARLGLTRRCLELLSAYRFPVSIQTKSPLVLRDLDLLRQGRFDVGFTLTAVNESARSLEPKAPSPEARLQALESLASEGVETWIFLGPIIPFVNDDEANLSCIVKAAASTKSSLIYDRLRLHPGVLESLRVFLEEVKPSLAEQVPRLLSTRSAYWREVEGKIQKLCRWEGVRCEPAFPPRPRESKLLNY